MFPPYGTSILNNRKKLPTRYIQFWTYSYEALNWVHVIFYTDGKGNKVSNFKY